MRALLALGAAGGRLRGLRPGRAGPRRAGGTRRRLAAGALRAFDAFPMTHHVECVAVLTSRPDATDVRRRRTVTGRCAVGSDRVSDVLAGSARLPICAVSTRRSWPCSRPRSATCWCRRSSRTGGHLGPNLGVVELTLALHRVFDSPTEPILFDTGHQAYVHKILTGRAGADSTLRQTGGLSGYPSRAESPHDWIENSHASTALSYADGLAKAFAVRGERRPVVAVVGDGALTGGMCWEALNNIAAADRPVVIVVNDNGRSYAPTIGGLAEHLAALRLRPGYERMLGTGQATRSAARRSSAPPLYDALHGMKRGIKDLLAPQGMFEDLGLKYVGPVDGHDVAALETRVRAGPRLRRPGDRALRHPQGLRLPAGRERRGRPDAPVARLRPRRPGVASASRGRTLDERVRRRDRRASASSATTSSRSPPRCASRPGSARSPAASRERFFDVGIAEQHAVTSAAGLAMGGLHPVVAVYATFLNRAFDQVLMDVALHRLPVTFVLDRAGHHRRRRPEPQRHVGPGDPRRRARAADRRAARRADAARRAARGGRGRRRADRRALPEDAARRRPARACAGSAASTCWPSPTPTATSTCWWSPSARLAADVLERGRRGPRRPASPCGSSTRAGSTPVDPALVELAAGAGWWSPSRTASSPAASARGRPGAARPRASTCRRVQIGMPAEFLDARQGRRRPKRGSGSRCRTSDGASSSGLSLVVTDSGPDADVSDVRHSCRIRDAPDDGGRTTESRREGGLTMRVLVVEDEVQLAEAVARGLRREGMAVDVASDGDDGYRKASLTRYDVVVLDRDLPGMSGDEICRRLTDEGVLTRVHDADRERHGRGQGGRAGARRRRLPGQAVRVRRTGRAGAGARPAHHAGRAAGADGRRHRARLRPSAPSPATAS